jgi:hypothetical protein
VAGIRLCLDTSAYSRLMRGQPKLQERLELADEILLPATMLGEIYTGFQGGSRLSVQPFDGALSGAELREGRDASRGNPCCGLKARLPSACGPNLSAGVCLRAGRAEPLSSKPEARAEGMRGADRKRGFPQLALRASKQGLWG